MSTCAVPATGVFSATKKLNADSERQLIVRAKNGDEAAFAALFDAHKKRVYSICLRMTGNIAQAEDLTQDAFIQVSRKLAHSVAMPHFPLGFTASRSILC